MKILYDWMIYILAIGFFANAIISTITHDYGWGTICLLFGFIFILSLYY